MENLPITFPEHLRGTVQLPASKSISARALVMGTLAGDCQVTHLSDCDDTRVLREALQRRLPEIDILAAGTAMRFATAYFATCAGETHVLTGTERMRRRPIKVLVDALRQLGAHIDYAGDEGYPPLRIEGQPLEGGEVALPADVSSQYISALLMIGPTLRKGLRLRLVGEVVSRPYIDMTLGLMAEFGAQAAWTAPQEITVSPQPYASGKTFAVEPDWSAASYWYEMVALSADADARIVLPGLTGRSWQGDSVVQRLFEPLGVRTTYENGGAVLTKSPVSSSESLLELDFTTCPDLAQTLVVTCALTGRPFRFTGLQSLRIKETDRIAALQTELGKLGITLDAVSEAQRETLQMLEAQTVVAEAPVSIATYDDHRMAMAFAPAAMRCPQLSIACPEVVSKSYPRFWEDLRSLK